MLLILQLLHLVLRMNLVLNQRSSQIVSLSNRTLVVSIHVLIRELGGLVSNIHGLHILLGLKVLIHLVVHDEREFSGILNTSQVAMLVIHVESCTQKSGILQEFFSQGFESATKVDGIENSHESHNSQNSNNVHRIMSETSSPITSMRSCSGRSSS